MLRLPMILLPTGEFPKSLVRILAGETTTIVEEKVDVIIKAVVAVAEEGVEAAVMDVVMVAAVVAVETMEEVVSVPPDTC